MDSRTDTAPGAAPPPTGPALQAPRINLQNLPLVPLRAIVRHIPIYDMDALVKSHSFLWRRRRELRSCARRCLRHIIKVEKDGMPLPVVALAYHPTDNVLAYSMWGTTVIHIWSTKTNTRVATLDKHTRSIEALAYSPDGSSLASGSHDTTIRIWSTASNTCIGCLEGLRGSASKMVYHPNSKMLASCSTSGGEIYLWCTETYRALRVTKEVADCRSLDFHPSGEYIVGCTGTAIQLWSPLEDTHTVLEVPAGYSPGTSVAVHPDGNVIATAHGPNVRLWNMTDERSSGYLNHETWCVNAIAFHPNGRILASCANRTPGVHAIHHAIHLWRLADNTCIASFQGHDTFIYNIAFRPDGETLASHDEAGVIRQWNA